VAQVLKRACRRPADVVARYGGEEFMILLPQTPRQGAQHMAQQVLEAVAAFGILHDESQTTHYVSVSVGIACFDDASGCWAYDSPGLLGASDLVRAADKALYSAKHAGRGQAKLRDIGDADTDTAVP
jgi:diguanylate cyclase (GGDEF)-like protein